MRIGIACYPTYGGSGVVATELGKALARKNHHIHFITYDYPTRLDCLNHNLHYHKVVIRTYPLFKYPPYELALASRMVNVVLNEKLDLLHVHYAIPHASAAYMAKVILKDKGISIPVITTLHGTDITLVGKEENLKSVVSFSINQSDGVTAVSKHLKKETLDHFNITKQIEVIPNFIDLSRFKRKSNIKSKKEICYSNEKLLIHVSNFRKVKRIEDLIPFFYKIKQHLPCKLLLVGDGPERNSIEETSRKLGIFGDIFFLGNVENIEDILSISDLFLMPSEKESFGLAALEAMACGVPIITTNVGGLPELNTHGVTGFMNKVGDIECMIKNALVILDKENFLYFRNNALKRAELFDIAKILPLYEDFYDKVLNH